MSKPYPSGLFWFRRDLRLQDNHGLYQALSQCEQLHCVFIFDTDILAGLPRQDRRVEFILRSTEELDEALRRACPNPGGGLIVRHGPAVDEVAALALALGVAAVFTNHDDEPAAQQRDDQVRTQLSRQGIALHTFKDQVIFERRELLTQGGSVYGV
ncbi:MAG: deoxyribodipyrimidine photo-lyase, partial [Curvibacter sp.]|nr:deoxyribodipyrimidine photo-lyase [Curvibacter sp.]